MNSTALNIHVQKNILKPNQDFNLLLLCLQQETQGHDNIRDSRALWLGDKDMLCTTGFSRVIPC